MPHIHTAQGWHDQTVSAYILRYEERWDGTFTAPRLLVHMHKKFGVLLQPGGHVELPENPWQAIAHELLEETGYEMDQLGLFQPEILKVQRMTYPTTILHPIPFYMNSYDAGENNHRHTDHAYVFLTAEEPRRQPGEGESTDLRWLTLDEVMATPADQISEVVKDAAPVAFSLISSAQWKLVSPLSFRTTV